MARPIKKGIDYFPLDVNFLSDIKVRKIMKSCGTNSISILISLLSNIYRDEGYFVKWDEDTAFLVADEVGTSEEEVEKIVEKSIQVGFFNQELYHNEKILTSRGIQERYKTASYKKKDNGISQLYKLPIAKIDVDEVSDDGNRVIDSESTQRKVKESKGKESKASSDDEDENPIRLFEDNIGNLSPIQMQDLLQWQDELGKELTMFAVSHAAMKSAKYYGFVQNLFKDWSSHNIDTVEKAKNYENQKQPSYKQKEERSSEYEYIRENNDPGW